jgi:hypothetical protein
VKQKRREELFFISLTNSSLDEDDGEGEFCDVKRVIDSRRWRNVAMKLVQVLKM